jgi:hypothetical protein
LSGIGNLCVATQEGSLADPTLSSDEENQVLRAFMNDMLLKGIQFVLTPNKMAVFRIGTELNHLSIDASDNVC